MIDPFEDARIEIEEDPDDGLFHPRVVAPGGDVLLNGNGQKTAQAASDFLLWFHERYPSLEVMHVPLSERLSRLLVDEERAPVAVR